MTPPRFATWLLETFGHPDTSEEVQGDLLELYACWVQTLGERRANWRYSLSALKLLRPLAKSKRSEPYTPFFLSPVMIRNYLTVAFRNLIRNKAFSVINVLGLALGLACSLLILLWVQDERSVDNFHAHGKSLYLVYERQQYEGKTEAQYNTPGLLADELKRVIPEVQYATSTDRDNTPTFEASERISKMEGMFAGADFFNMFSYPLLQGTPETALNAPNGIAISRKMAELFFGSSEKAIGQSIRYQNRENLFITAVFENVPANSSQQFDFLRTWKDYLKQNEWARGWGSTNPFTIIQLRSGRNGELADPAIVEAKIKDFLYRYKAKNNAFVEELALQPFSEKYLHATFKNGHPDGGRSEYVRLFSLVAIFILVIACINFMNLATARSGGRAKEVGVRKVVGAVRMALMGQFVGEAVLLTCFAMLVAVGLVAVSLTAFNHLTGKQLVVPIRQPEFWVALLGLLLTTGFLSGSYPALFLSGLSPIRVLKGRLQFSPGAATFRKALVVFQFSLSMLLMVGMLVMYRQMNYIQRKNLGYTRENLIYVPIEGDLTSNYDLFKEEVSRMPGILAVSRIRNSPTDIDHHTTDIRWIGEDANQATSFADVLVGYDFVKTMQLHLQEGRDFSKAFGADSVSFSGFVLNEAAVQKIGYKNPVGQPLWWGDHEGKIIGVLKNFHFSSMHQPIEPLVMRLDETRPYGTMLVRTKAGRTKEALASLEKVYKALNPKFPFTYQFSDLEFTRLYRSEQLVSQLANYFALLAIFISCLGLFGLATFTAEQRTKEIGVRKVLGASVGSVVTLLSRDFLKPVLLAILITTPIAWYIMNRWLADFAYRIDIEWWTFALPGGLAVGIALLTVSFQSVKAALANPVKSLRSE